MEASVASPSLVGRMGASLAGEWRQAGPAQRFAYLVGGTLILVGLAHLAAWLVLGGAWQGPVSLRKPTTFGISFGLTTSTRTGRLGRSPPVHQPRARSRTRRVRSRGVGTSGNTGLGGREPAAGAALGVTSSGSCPGARGSAW